MSNIYFSLSYWLYLPQTWIILGILFILLELTDGSRIFFLPIGLAALLLAVQVHLAVNGMIAPDLIPMAWYWMLMEWAVAAFLISLALVTFRRFIPAKQGGDEDGDINTY